MARAPRLLTVGDPLLLLGWHRAVRPALRAVSGGTARRVVVLVAAGKRPPEAPEVHVAGTVDLHGPEDAILAAADRLLEGARPAAVVALAERTVLAAARLRAVHDLPGNNPDVALRCADKVVMKRAMDAAGVPVAPWREVDARTEPAALVNALGLPLMLKPRRDSGGRGQVRVEDAASLADALTSLDLHGAVGTGWLAEGWLEGVEMSVETFVHGGQPCFANPTHYHVPRHASVMPADLAPDAWQAIRAFTTRALRAAGVERGITHLELFRRGDELVFGELAIRPPGGRLMRLIKPAWGFDPWEAMLRLELGEAFTFPDSPRRAAGAWVLHPGAGTLRAVRGLEQAGGVPHVRRVNLKLADGGPPWQIPERVGSGQDLGAIYAQGPDAAAVADALTSARMQLEFELE